LRGISQVAPFLVTSKHSLLCCSRATSNAAAAKPLLAIFACPGPPTRSKAPPPLSTSPGHRHRSSTIPPLPFQEPETRSPYVSVPADLHYCGILQDPGACYQPGPHAKYSRFMHRSTTPAAAATTRSQTPAPSQEDDAMRPGSETQSPLTANTTRPRVGPRCPRID